jgi:hypothetical protein
VCQRRDGCGGRSSQGTACGGCRAMTCPMLAISAVRGIGFAVLAVVGSALTAVLAPPIRHGEAVGLFGLGPPCRICWWCPERSPWLRTSVSGPSPCGNVFGGGCPAGAADPEVISAGSCAGLRWCACDQLLDRGLPVLDLPGEHRLPVGVDRAGVVELLAHVDPDPQLRARHLLTTPVLPAQQPSDDPACSSVNSDRAQISISGRGVPDDGAATPQKPPNGRQRSATPRRPGRPERLVPNINNLT